MTILPGKMGIGAGSSKQGEDGKSSYQVWLDLGNEGSEQDFIDSLIGPVGPQGNKGDAGPVGPAGLTWRHQYEPSVTYVQDDAVGYAGASWFCLQTTTGNVPNEENSIYWALLASQGARGPEGPVGPQGPAGSSGKFTVNDLTETDVKSLRSRLKSVTPQKFWAYRVKSPTTTGATKEFQIADLNITFQHKTTSADSVQYNLLSFDKTKPALYLVRRFTVYGTTSLEGKVTPNYRYQDLNAGLFQVDDYDYADARSQWIMNIIDSTNKVFYAVNCQMNVETDGGRYLYIEVNKIGEEGYKEI